MTDRREALKIIGAGAVAFPILGQEHAAHEAAAVVAKKYVAKVFDAPQLELLAELTERIIPRTDTPGAADVGVPLLIDRVAATREPGPWREMLAWFAGQGKTPEERLAVLTRASTESGTDGARYFKMLKDATIDQYYGTKEGLTQELGWNGNTYLSDFPGCTHPEHQVQDGGKA